MYKIFAPLDVHERLPRELLLEARRHHAMGRRELAGALWLPALALLLLLAGWGNLNALISFGAIGAMFAGMWAFVLVDERRSQ